MRNIVIALLSIFMASGCSLKNVSPTHLFDNFFPKRTKSHLHPSQKKVQALRRKQNTYAKIHTFPKTYLYYLRSASLPELRRYLDSGKAAEDLSLREYTLLRARRKGMEEDALIRYGSLKELIAAYDKTRNPRFKARILELMKQEEKEESQ